MIRRIAKVNHIQRINASSRKRQMKMNYLNMVKKSREAKENESDEKRYVVRQ